MNILLINKEDNIQQMLIETIKRWRSNFMAVTTTSDAIRAIRDGTFDLIITEPAMLDIRNKEIREKIKEGIKRTQVIVVSSSNSVKTALEFIESGADDYFIGPFSAEKVKERLEDLLRTRKISGAT
ncbi:response regulator [bacterium]|nr:response regulator [bacterium]MBU1873263.1 response regulator [bacterium]